MHINQLCKDTYPLIFNYLTLKETITFSYSSKMMRIFFCSIDCFSECVGAFRTITHLSKECLHSFEILKVYCIGTVFLNKEMFDNAMESFFKEILSLKNDKKQILFSNEDFLPFLENNGFYRRILDMLYQEYIEINSTHLIRSFRWIEGKENASYKNMILTIINQFFDLTLEKEIEKIKKAIKVNPSLLLVFKSQYRNFQYPYLPLPLHPLWSGLSDAWNYLGNLEGFITKSTTRPQMCLDRMSTHGVHKLSEALKFLEKETKVS